MIIDIPGIVSGSYNGAGVGVRFLKHLERVKVICHLVSLSSSFFLNRNIMVNRYLSIRDEIKRFNKKISLINEIVIISKDDICSKNSLIQKKIFESFLLKKNIKYLKLSSFKGYGLNKLIKILFSFLN